MDGRTATSILVLLKYYLTSVPQTQSIPISGIEKNTDFIL